MSFHGHEDGYDCSFTLSQVQAFLHHEMAECEADMIRAHLDGCEDCLENFDIEDAIARMIKRCCQPERATSDLRMRIVSMTTVHREM